MGLFLHTDSGHFEVFNITNVDELRSKSVDALVSREKELYQMVKKSTYKDFMDEMRKLFGEAEDIKNALMNFKKSNLIINLGLPAQLQFVEQQIEFTLTSERSEDIGKLIAEQLNISTSDFIIESKKESMRFSFKYDESNIKAFLNAYYDGQRKFVDRSSNNSRSKKTNPLRYANRAFRELASSGKIGEITVNEKPVDQHFTVNTNNSMKDNFDYKKADIQKAINENTPEAQQLRQAILNSRQIIHDKLRSFMNGIPDLEKAFDVAWNNKMGEKGMSENEILNKFEFFAKGKNLNAGVSGAVQELYTAIIAEYVNIKIGEGIHTKVAEILGNIAKGNEQPKDDVQILGRIGIQVKAYSMNREITNMSTNIHPNALGTSLAPYGNENIADTIVQLVFNSSNGNYNDIAEQLEPALAQLMNMTTSEQISDTICFYMVDGQFLVPGSRILETLRTTSYKIRIRTTHKPQTDEDFEKSSYNREDGTTGPAFLQYFNGAKAKFTAPFTEDNVTSDNTKLYNDLMNKNISIDVKFDYSFMGSMEYSIY